MDEMDETAIGDSDATAQLPAPLTGTEEERTVMLAPPNHGVGWGVVRRLPRAARPDLAHFVPHVTAASAPTIIPGARLPAPVAPRAPALPRSRRQSAIAAAVTGAVVLAALVATAALQPAFITRPFVALTALAAGGNLPTSGTSVTYRVQSGDTIEKVAQHFDVTIGGIYELNGFYLGTEITVGQVIKIPLSPTYGAHFRPTAPPIVVTGPIGGGAPAGTVFGPCQFCSIAGYTTGGGPCAPHATTNLGFDLIQPDPGAYWVRGFTWYHDGVDISTHRYGTPIVAAQSGQVIFAGWDPYGGGWSVKINHCWGLATSYCHMEKLLVRLGQYVHVGDVIGLQGSTGNSTGPHLHFMAWWNNQFVNPLNYYTHLGYPSS